MDANYVYLPDFDGEWSVMDIQEYTETGGESEYGKAIPCKLVISLGGHRGHYLCADYIAEVHTDIFCDLRVKLSKGDAERMLDAYRNAITYSDHQHFTSYRCEPICSACEFIVEDADKVEQIIAGAGYITEWNDGVNVFKVEDSG